MEPIPEVPQKRIGSGIPEMVMHCMIDLKSILLKPGWTQFWIRGNRGIALLRSCPLAGPEGNCAAVVWTAKASTFKLEIELIGPQPCHSNAAHLKRRMAMFIG